MSWCENGYGKLSSKPYLKLLVGGLVLSPLIFLFPSLYGEGYDSLRLFIEGKTEADWMQIMSGSMFAEKSNFLLLYVGLVVMTRSLQPVQQMVQAVVVEPLRLLCSSVALVVSSLLVFGIWSNLVFIFQRRTLRSMVWQL